MTFSYLQLFGLIFSIICIVSTIIIYKFRFLYITVHCTPNDNDPTPLVFYKKFKVPLFKIFNTQWDTNLISGSLIVIKVQVGFVDKLWP